MSFNPFVLPSGTAPQANFMRQMVPGMPMQVAQFPQQVRPIGDFNQVPQYQIQPQTQIPPHLQYQHQMQPQFMQYQQPIQQIQPPVAEVYEPPQPVPNVQQQPLVQPQPQQSSSSGQDFNQSIVRKSIEILCQHKKPMSAAELSQQLASHIVRLSEKQLIEVLSNYPNNFTIYTKEGTEDHILSVCTKLGLCKEHCSKQGQCPGIPVCDGLHICKFYLLSNSCRVEKQGKNCLFGHDLTSPHNMSLLRQNMLEHLSVHSIKNLFRTTESRGRTTMPSICKFYNINVGCRAEEEGKACPYLHICKFYVIGQCRFGKRCKRSHNVFDQQITDILTKYGINTNRTPKEILQEIRNVEFDVGDDASSQASAHSKDPYRTGVDSDNEDPAESDDVSASSSDDPPADICIFHLRGRCAFGKSCRKSHKNMTYQWQYRKKNLNQWEDFQHHHNVEVEYNFGEVARTECFVKTESGVLKLNFDTMEAVLQENNQVVVQMILRRLSTPSSEVEKFQPLATVWKWFWQSEDGNWQEYGQAGYGPSRYQTTVDSSSMEQNFLKNPTGQLQFNTLGYEYLMDFEQMIQQNLQYGTQRKVRRRPVYVDEKQMEKNKKKAPEPGSQTGKEVSMVTGPALTRPMQNYIPAEWEIHLKMMGGQQHVIEHFHRTVITGDNSPKIAEEVKRIKELFYQTMSPNQYITCIERVENGELWMNYVSKREKMSMKRRTIGDVNEKRLFHGTSNKFIDAICRQGFDFRFSGQSTGSKYGKGSYFTKSAKFADSYTDRSRDKEMFLVRVLTGDYTLGHSSMVRPPHKNPKNPFDLYDSCVDDITNPNIFVIFTFDQVYPEYVIKYRS
ncbi:protein mono-ADP-ribosyltransferase PARP12-like [Saccostrea echinata]|uniref:protein mono-ADP-ribosyltransferase PARP12-like n=1 Tax=Saccostrea echinata TaxID=191078 RepID=UPI002A834FD0|nr:protein mono-ADP-ribosyltransferase PARP12-like [Saccostrea echinata]